MRNIALLPLLGACALLPGAVPAQAPPVAPPATAEERALAGIRPAAIRAHMSFLADDLLEGRRTGSRGYELAARYVATQLRGAGARAGGDRRRATSSPCRCSAWRRWTAECSAVLVRPSGERTELRFGTDYVTAPLAETETAVTAPVVFAGFGVTAPELLARRLRGHSTSRARSSPSWPAGRPGFPSEPRAYYSDSRGLIQQRRSPMARSASWRSSRPS